METEKSFRKFFKKNYTAKLPYKTKKESGLTFRSNRLPHGTLFETWCRVSLFIRRRVSARSKPGNKDQNALHKVEAEDGDDVYYLTAPMKSFLFPLTATSELTLNQMMALIISTAPSINPDFRNRQKRKRKWQNRAEKQSD